MPGIGTFLGLIGIGIVGMAICAVIINIVNRITESLASTGYEKLTGECLTETKGITNAINVLNITRDLAIIPLIIFILLTIIGIIGLIQVIRNPSTSDAKPSDKKSGSTTLTSTIIIIIMITLSVIFIGYSIIYTYVYVNLNQIKTSCFTGKETDQNTPLGNFTYAKSFTQTQMVICIIMSFISIFGLIVSVVLRK